MLDVRRLRILEAFAREGTVAEAAKALSYTPSAVSQHLAQLERDAGVPLFRREGRRLRLTDAAQMLVGHAAEVLALLERAEAELAAHAGAVVGTVRVAAFQLATQRLVLPALAAVRETSPALRVETVGTEAEASLPLLRAGRIDLVVAEEYAHAPRPPHPQIDRIALPPDDMVLVLPAGHPAARTGDAVPLASLRHEPWATAEEGTAYADMFVRLCRSVGGFEPDVRFRNNDFAVLLGLAAEGQATVVLPALGHPGRDPRVAVRALAEGHFPRRIFLAVRAADRRRPALAAVIDALCRVACEEAGAPV